MLLRKYIAVGLLVAATLWQIGLGPKIRDAYQRIATRVELLTAL